MFGKHFESMYEGSMYGAGVNVFAVWGYVIAKAQRSRVELNPRKLADTLGGTVQEIEQAIEYLCKPDSESRFKEYDGRRLVKEGEFQYFVPSHEYYRSIKNEEHRREYNRIKQAEYRAKKQRDTNGKNRMLRQKESAKMVGETAHMKGTPILDLEQEKKDVVMAKAGLDPVA